MPRSIDTQTQLIRDLSAAASGQASAPSINADWIIINGTNGNDILVGTDADEQINGLAGDDVLVGNGGNDWLNGGAGIDTMSGGTGDDAYHVDNARDVVQELADSGIDEVYATVSYALQADSSIETLVANDPFSNINLTGSNFGQSIYGNGGANSLLGLGGDDALYGLGGNDVLVGGTGDDYLDGGDGLNTLGGGEGKDTFGIHDSALNALDIIRDFTVGDDKILFFANPGSVVELAENQFFVGTEAHDADDRIVYNKATGQVFYDADGNGANEQSQFALLINKPQNLSHLDFSVVGI